MKKTIKSKERETTRVICGDWKGTKKYLEKAEEEAQDTIHIDINLLQK